MRLGPGRSAQSTTFASPSILIDNAPGPITVIWANNFQACRTFQGCSFPLRRYRPGCRDPRPAGTNGHLIFCGGGAQQVGQPDGLPVHTSGVSGLAVAPPLTFIDGVYTWERPVRHEMEAGGYHDPRVEIKIFWRRYEQGLPSAAGAMLDGPSTFLEKTSPVGLDPGRQSHRFR